MSTVPNGDFELHDWRSPPVLRRKDPPPLDLQPDANGVLDLSNWNSGGGGCAGYTSIRDLLVSSPQSCVASPTGPGCEIQIRNRLVKQAAFAYLQLTPSCTDSSSSPRRCQPLRRLLAAAFASFRALRRCFGFIGRMVCCDLR